MGASHLNAELAWRVRYTDPQAAQAWAVTASADRESQEATGAQVVTAFLHWRSERLVEALQLASDVEPALRAHNWTLWLARALSMQAVVVSDLGQSDRAMTLYREQLELAQQVGDIEMQATAHNDIGVLFGPNDPQRSLEYFARAYDLLGQEKSPNVALQGLTALNMAETHHLLGQVERGDELIDLGGRMLAQARAWTYWPFYVSLRVDQLKRGERYDDARHILQEAMARIGDAGSPVDPPGDAGHLLRAASARLALECQQPRRALDDLYGMDTWPSVLTEVRLQLLDLRAQAHHALGDHAAAYHTVRSLLDVTRQRHRYERDTQLQGMEVVHRTADAQRQRQEAEQAAQQLRANLDELQRLKGQLEQLSATDALTGLGNRRQFDHDLHRSQEGDAVLVIDIDHFKRINDTYGHAVGDHALREVAQRLAGALRRGDCAYRYGGEEFTVLLRSVGHANVHAVAERIRSAVSAGPVPSISETVTVSVGAAVLGTDSPPGAVANADRAMYRAKQGGRNRTCVFQSVEQETPLPAPC